jgi:adenine deaminase
LNKIPETAGEVEHRADAVAAARGRRQFDVLLSGGVVVDVCTGELRAADVGIVGPWIASVHRPGSRRDAAEVLDVTGRYVAPGFIDMHVHFESSMLTPASFASAVIPHGTTTAFCDPHELANVAGLDGVRYAVEASRDLPLRFVFQVPSCVPPVPGLEYSGADFLGEQVGEMLTWPEVAGVAEVMDMRGVLNRSPRMVSIVEAGLSSGKLVEGHAFGLTGPELQAYLAAGISSDHEITSADGALERLRAGMTVELRGGIEHILPEVVAELNSLPTIPTNMTLCTDDVFAHVLLAEGSVDHLIRRLIGYGLAPVSAIRLATLNAAYRLGRTDLGAVGAGRRADLVVLGDLVEVTIEDVLTAGRHVASGGRMLHRVGSVGGVPPTGTTKLAPMQPDDFRLPVPGVHSGTAKVRGISGVRFTRLSEFEVDVRDGFAVPPPGCVVQVAVHRHGRVPAVPRVAFVSEWGRWEGAVATTVSHDTHNLVVFGREPRDMAIAANAVIDSGGGVAVAATGELRALVELPIAGLLSYHEPEEVARQQRRLEAAAKEVADFSPLYHRPLFQVMAASLACNPGPHLTDVGLADGTSGEMLETVVSASSR